MKILITGASGMVGSKLVDDWLPEHRITAISRFPGKQKKTDHLKWLSLDDFLNWQAGDFASYNAIVNLAGANVAGRRWTQHYKQRDILGSRVRITSHIANNLALLRQHAPRLINASAIGIYPAVYKKTGRAFDETFEISQHVPETFLEKVVFEWECALRYAQGAGVSVAICRFSNILDQSGGILKKLWLPFQLGLGAVLGSGQQPFCWVSLKDVSRAIEWLVQHPECEGVFNVVAPEISTQADFAKSFARSIKRPLFLKIPSSVLKILLGHEMAEALLLKGPEVVSRRLPDYGFTYQDQKISHLHL